MNENEPQIRVINQMLEWIIKWCREIGMIEIKGRFSGYEVKIQKIKNDKTK